MKKLNIGIVITLIIFIGLSACKSKKSIAKDPSGTTNSGFTTNAEEEKGKGGLELKDTNSVAAGDQNNQEQRAKNEVPDSLYVRMERTPCLGTCPSYTLTIYNSGYAVYEGRNFVDMEGRYYARMNDPELEKIRQKVKEIDYYSLNRKYDSPITDIPSTITTVNIDGEYKRVVNRHKGPEKLKEFENMLDEIMDRFEWKKLPEKKDK